MITLNLFLTPPFLYGITFINPMANNLIIYLVGIDFHLYLKGCYVYKVILISCSCNATRKRFSINCVHSKLKFLKLLINIFKFNNINITDMGPSKLNIKASGTSIQANMNITGLGA